MGLFLVVPVSIASGCQLMGLARFEHCLETTPPTGQKFSLLLLYQPRHGVYWTKGQYAGASQAPARQAFPAHLSIRLVRRFQAVSSNVRSPFTYFGDRQSTQ